MPTVSDSLPPDTYLHRRPPALSVPMACSHLEARRGGPGRLHSRPGARTPQALLCRQRGNSRLEACSLHSQGSGFLHFALLLSCSNCSQPHSVTFPDPHSNCALGPPACISGHHLLGSAQHGWPGLGFLGQVWASCRWCERVAAGLGCTVVLLSPRSGTLETSFMPPQTMPGP